MTKLFKYTAIAATTCALFACQNTEDKVQPNVKSETLKLWPQPISKIKQDPKLEKKIEALLAEMTLEHKVAQMVQPELRSITVEEMRQYGFGSFLNGGGSFPQQNKYASVQDWIKTADDFYKACLDDSLDGSSIPCIWGTDAVHGHNNVLGATLFPHNIGLGAANNPDLIKDIAAAIAREVAATAIDWDFSPTVAVARDDRWGRAYESFSEDPAIVRSYAGKYVEGIQGEAGKDFLSNQHILATAKHFVGDGGTDRGVDQGNNLASEAELINIHAQGYVTAIEAGVQAIMASFNSWHGQKLHGYKYLLTDVLKERMNFDGLVVGDWNGHGQVAGCSNESCAAAINAGVDIIMVPEDWKAFYHNTLAQVRSGEISEARINDAVTRILRVKLRAGVFNDLPSQRLHAANSDRLGHPEHKAIARQAVRESLVLLKNNHSLLPLNPKQKILLAGDGADNISKQNGGWTLTWQGTGNTNDDFPNATSIYQGFKNQVEAAGGSVMLSENGQFSEKPDVAIVVIGEEPYAEMQGDIKSGTFEYQPITKADLALLKSLKSQNIPVVTVFLSGRPLWMNKEINQSDAFVAAWLPGSEGAGIADVLLRDVNGQVQYDFTGKLSFSWPAKANAKPVNAPYTDKNDALFKLGYGLTYQDDIQLAQLQEDYADMPKLDTSSDLVLFSQAPKLGYTFALNTGEQSTAINASVVTTDAITFSSQNRFVQEDSFKINWTAEQKLSAIAMQQNNGINISAYADANAALVFEVKADKPVRGNINVLVQEKQQALDTVSINSLIKTDGQWQPVAVKLNCFKQTDFSQPISTIWGLSSAQMNELSVANIRLSTAEQKNLLDCE
ncbi:glycoside hydrolase family 3 N-terminal domain-containing protein [Gayadomonas joobiniege]|uniref:glycoside hydrolase family 3 protein n=1 Tax=Gayadomonas joobiniege TaxID=1234606 RepID=UPI0012DBCB7B